MKAYNDKQALGGLADDEITTWVTSPTCSLMRGADLLTAIMEVKPLIEQRIETSLRASTRRLGNAMMHLIEGGGKRMKARSLGWLARPLATPIPDF